MIKLIASDLDGTLLTPERNLPQRTFPLIEALLERGIYFVPASGRQYANLKMLFAPVAERIPFLAENGALAAFRGEVLYTCPIEEREVLHAVNVVRELPDLYPMLCTPDCAYIEDDYKPFYDYSFSSYTNCEKLSSLNDVIGKYPVCKIAVYDKIGSAVNGGKLLPEKLPQLRTILSGADWLDISSPKANKGAGIRFLQDYFHISPDECLAFGDHMNDFELLSSCRYAYVPENAFGGLKAHFPRTIPSNRDEGVIQALERILKQTD